MKTSHPGKFVKHVLASVLAIVCASAGLVHAIPVTKITITDIGANENPPDADVNDGNYDSAIDGISGAFRFSNINDITYLGASLFYGDVDAAPGIGPGVIDTSVANGHTTFTTGFLFAGSPFRPITQGPIVMDISVTGGNMVMTIDSMPFAGIYGNDPNTGQVFVLPPQSSPPGDCTYTAGNAFEPLTVKWLQWLSPTTVAFKIAWSHCITSAEDPFGAFVGFHAHWRLEGIADMTGSGVLPMPTSYTTGAVETSDPLPEYSPITVSGGCALSPGARFDMVMVSMLLAAVGYLALGRYRRKKTKTG